tara:strand:+ start:1083 stop:3155 length:2073 start_codon:yes stop_codon:yes gene_type:complete
MPTDTSNRPPLEYQGPYERWVFDIGQAYTFPNALPKPFRYMGALLEAKPGSGNPEAVLLSYGGETLKAPARVPTLWRPKDIDPVYRPVIVDTKGAKPLAAGDLQESPDRFRIDLPLTERTVRSMDDIPLPEVGWVPAQGVGPDTDQALVIIAVIDDGMPFAHGNFRDPHDQAQSRVEFCWLQSAESSGDQPVSFGSELTRGDIERLISEHDGDEKSIYRSVGETGGFVKPSRPLEKDITHGSIVTDIAAGYEAGDEGFETADRKRIIAVQLPDAAGWDTSGFGKDMFVVSAFHYIFERADRIAEGYGVANPHLLINFSHGISGGPHDGSLAIERAMSELVMARRWLVPGARTELVLPSGNMFEEKLHGVITEQHLSDAGGAYPIVWQLSSNDRTPSYLELWFEPGVADPGNFSIDIQAQSGGVSLTSDPLLANEPAEPDGGPHIARIIRHDRTIGLVGADLQDDGKRRLVIALAPTETFDPSLSDAPPGDWTITVRQINPDSSVGDGIFCHVQRDEDLGDRNTGARQSHLKEAPFAPPAPENPFVRTFGSINGIATGPETIMVAGHVESDGTPVPYGSAGRKDGKGKQVATSAVSDRGHGKSKEGVVAAGTRTGTSGKLVGTSAAAPELVRTLSNLLLETPATQLHNDVTPDILNLFEADPSVSTEPIRLGRRFKELRRRRSRRIHDHGK